MKGYKHEMDMTEGPLLKKIIIFSLPLVLTGLLQCLYNAADLVVVGHFEGHIALAAVGSTGALTNLIVGLFMGLSVGAGVCAAQYIGAREYERVSKVLHTAIVTSVLVGVIVAMFGIIFAPHLLRLMETPENVIEYATLYIRIIFCGVPVSLLYNYCAAVLRASGDTKHPLIFLTVSGILNVFLNLILVVFFGLGVAGVAIGTIAAQALSAIMIVTYMARSESYLRIDFRKLGISRKYLFRMMAIGIPSGINSCFFALSNVVVQSSINSFEDVVMAGNSASQNIEGFLWVAMDSVAQAAITFAGQNVGAKKYERLGKVISRGMIAVSCVWAVMASLTLLLRYPLVGLYAKENPEVIQAAINRLMIIVPTYLICGNMGIVTGTLRGMGRSTASMVLTLVGVCGVRILWVNTIFQVFNTPMSIYISYPVSWFISLAGNFIAFMIVYKRAVRTGELPEEEFSFLRRKKKA